MTQERKWGVLIVDDEKIIIDIFGDYLESEGFMVFVASSAEEANNQLGKYRDQIEIILLDPMMPDRGGLDFLQEIRDKGNQIPAIIMTGFPSVETCRDAFKMKVADYIVKPFKVDDLVKIIKENLEDRAQ